MISSGSIARLAPVALMLLIAACGGHRSDDHGDALVHPVDDAAVDGGSDLDDADAAADAADDTDAGLDPYVVPDGCNPLAAEWDCLLPFPSDVFLVDDATLPSGRRVVVDGAAQLVRNDGVAIDPHAEVPVDGFSVHPPILALFPTGFVASELIGPTAPFAASLDIDCETVLLDAETGERVPHFAEVDPLADDVARRALIIRPHVRLAHDRRYIVAIWGLSDPGGSELRPPEGFRRVRDGLTSGHPALEAIGTRYDDEVFPVLEQAGLTRATLQLAWDFTTASRESVAGDMLAIRRDLLDRLADAPPPVTVSAVQDDVDDLVFRLVEGTLRVPLYLDAPEPGARIARDPSGAVAANGEVEVPFTVLVPRSLEHPAEDGPGRLILYGHSFFGGRDEHERAWLREQADRDRYAFLTVDWWGMSRDDVAELVDAIGGHPSDTFAFTERLHQGMANFVAAAEAAATTLAADPSMSADGAPLYDPAFVSFYGNSQGGILGGTLAALAPRLDRVVLGVGGAGIALMATRSRQFAEFVDVMRLWVPDPLDIQKWIALSTVNIDRMDPVTYAPWALREPLPGDPGTRRVLHQVGLGDTDVTNLASYLLARTLGLSHLQPATTAIEGMPPADAPFDGSALVTFDFGIEPGPGLEARPPEDGNEAHNGVRRLDAAQRQIDAFLRPDGAIEHTCDGACDPE